MDFTIFGFFHNIFVCFFFSKKCSVLFCYYFMFFVFAFFFFSENHVLIFLGGDFWSVDFFGFFGSADLLDFWVC